MLQLTDVTSPCTCGQNVITSETKLRDEDYGMIVDTLCLDGKVGTPKVPRKLVVSLALHSRASCTIACPRTVQTVQHACRLPSKSTVKAASAVR